MPAWRLRERLAVPQKGQPRFQPRIVGGDDQGLLESSANELSHLGGIARLCGQSRHDCSAREELAGSNTGLPDPLLDELFQSRFVQFFVPKGREDRRRPVDGRRLAQLHPARDAIADYAGLGHERLRGGRADVEPEQPGFLVCRCHTSDCKRSLIAGPCDFVGAYLTRTGSETVSPP